MYWLAFSASIPPHFPPEKGYNAHTDGQAKIPIVETGMWLIRSLASPGWSHSNREMYSRPSNHHHTLPSDMVKLSGTTQGWTSYTTSNISSPRRLKTPQSTSINSSRCECLGTLPLIVACHTSNDKGEMRRHTWKHREHREQKLQPDQMRLGPYLFSLPVSHQLPTPDCWSLLEFAIIASITLAKQVQFHVVSLVHSMVCISDLRCVL